MRRLRIAALACVAPLLVFAQQDAPPLTFEVASIKPSDLNRPGLPWRLGPDSFTGQVSVKDLILFSYELEGYQIEGGPDWVRTERYDVQAKAAKAATPGQIKSMLRAMLAERFHLRLNRESKMMTGFALLTDKNGPKLPPMRMD